MKLCFESIEVLIVFECSVFIFNRNKLILQAKRYFVKLTYSLECLIMIK